MLCNAKKPRRLTNALLLAGLVLIAQLVSSRAAICDEIAVDVQLIVAADVSESMRSDIGRLQRRGYAAALRSDILAQAIGQGRHGRIAFSYLEWGDAGRITVVIPWTLIESADDSGAVAARLDSSRITRLTKTSISHVLQFSGSHFSQSGYVGKRVVDVSGNGPNNQGINVTLARDRLVATGATINGLPIMTGIINPRGVFDTGFDLRLLDAYFADCVIGGPGAFVLPVRTEQDLAEAIKLKLVLEIAGPARVVPAQFQPNGNGRTPC